MRILGIDNGLNGAVVFIPDFGIVLFYDDYTIQISKKDKYNVPRMVEIINMLSPDFAYLEGAQAMPKQGVVSTFSTGYGFGLWSGILAALKIPYEIVPPKVWQNEFYKGKKHDGNIKNLSYQIASSLYPLVVKELRGPKGGLKDGRCDALLIATYGLRKNGG